jgi:hypothetical protein
MTFGITTLRYYAECCYAEFPYAEYYNAEGNYAYCH